MIRENGDVKFKAYGEEIDERFEGEYEAGDKWRVELCDGRCGWTSPIWVKAK